MVKIGFQRAALQTNLPQSASTFPWTYHLIQFDKKTIIGSLTAKIEENEAMNGVKSTVPGLAYGPGKDRTVKTPYGFLEGRRKVDGAEGLWRIKNSLYDLESFAKVHPGGAEWIRLTKGTDITELFESHHLTDKAPRLLPKFYIREAAAPRSVPLTFEPNGFYQVFKKRALEALKDVDFHRPSRKSNLIADLLASTAITLCITATLTQSYVLVILAGIFLAWTTIIAHNFFHMRDNFRMYYFDLSTMSSKDWRISHVMSHHSYPNTQWDYEIYSAVPFFNWYTQKDKSLGCAILCALLSPVLWSLTFVQQIIKRYYSVFFEYRSFEFRDAVPALLPIVMVFFSSSFMAAIKTWILVLFVASFVFSIIGFNAAHHHPDIFHDGDIYRKDMDWGLLEMDAVRGREVIDENDFLVLTNFGNHSLHHLLPTVDHTYLPRCEKAFVTTCKEFGVDTERWTQWELVKGQYQQLMRKEAKKNYR